jgi:predicted enzyme related to lactoylglutathione lyase
MAGALRFSCSRFPRTKHGKNRVHLDLRTRDLELELERLIGLGARILTDEPASEAGWRWHILADPDGNEFCVLQPPASYWRAR